MSDYSKCPKCGSTKIDTYRHPFAKVWCTDCGFVLREEGEGSPWLQHINFKLVKEDVGTISIEQDLSISVNISHQASKLPKGVYKIFIEREIK